MHMHKFICITDSVLLYQTSVLYVTCLFSDSSVSGPFLLQVGPNMLLTCPISFFVKINPIWSQACKVDKMYNFATLQLD